MSTKEDEEEANIISSNDTFFNPERSDN